MWAEERAQKSCKQCNRMFADWEALKKHWDKSTVHQGYNCLLCNNRWFAHWGAIQQHWRDSPIHKCQHCPKCDEYFPDFPALASHYWSKHGLICGKNGCTRKFATETLLNEHIQEAHCLCPFELCGLEFTKSQLEDHLYHKHMFCRKCSTYFPTETEFRDHKTTSAAHSWCPSCCIELESRIRLAEHCRVNHRRCETCKQNFFSEEAHTLHLVLSDKHHFCEKCMEDFTGPTLLVKHYLDPSSWPWGAEHHYCSRCSCDFDDSESLRNHYFSSDVHHYCYLCNEHFSTEAALIDHVREAASPHPYCVNCKVIFKTAIDLRRHIVQNPLNHHYCGQCDLNFRRSSELDHHKAVSSNHHFCKHCKVEYPNGESLLVHQEREHHYCRQCSIRFPTLEGLVSHKTYNANHFFCSGCDLDFPNQGALQKHVLAVHYYCERCEETFWTEASLKVHRRASVAHNECLECDLDFDDKDTLESHLQARHAYCLLCQETLGSRQFLESHLCGFHKDIYCGECKIMHEDSESLLLHRETVHHYCPECDVSFSSEDGLENHNCTNTQYHLEPADSDTLRLHQEAKNHQCEVCEEAFESSEALGKHVSWHHDYCGACGQVFADKEALLAHKSPSNEHHYGYPNCHKKARNDQDHVHHADSLIQPGDPQDPFEPDHEETVRNAKPIAEHVSNEDVSTDATETRDHDSQETAQTLVGSEKADTDEHYETAHDETTYDETTHDETAPDEKTTDSSGGSVDWHSALDITPIYYEGSSGGNPKHDIETEKTIVGRGSPKVEMIPSVEEIFEEEEKPLVETECIVCSQSFSSKSKMIKHCENGECYVLQSQVHALLANKDTRRVFTLVSIYDPPIRRPRDSAMRALKNKSTGLYKCLHCNEEFAETSRLGDHLDSNAHRERHFKCPRSGCTSAHFITFGALLDHLNETECAAWIKVQDDDRFDYIKTYLD